MKPFKSDQDLYDVNTYKGRVLHFIKFVSPMNLFYTEDKLQDINTLMKLTAEAEKQGSNQSTIQDDKGKKMTLNIEKNPEGSKFKVKREDGREEVYNDTEMWDKKYAFISNTHPQTGKTVPIFLRWSAFVPVNIPIALCMAVLPQTKPMLIFGQVLNQTYNFGVNIAYRNPDNEVSYAQLGGSYLMAVSTAVGMSLLMKRSMARFNFKGASAIVAEKAAPFLGVVTASCVNLFFSRYSDVVEGIYVFNEETNQSVPEHKSRIAGGLAMLQSSIARIGVPLPVFMFPPLFAAVYKKMGIFQRGAPQRLADCASLGVALWLGLALSLGAAPLKGYISASTLESKFHNIKGMNGSPLKRFYYNRGL